jgi:hypothetical protein
MTLDSANILTFIAQFALSAVGALWLASTKLGEKILGHRFDRQLTEIRHKQNEEIEELKLRLSRLADRGVRSNEREFLAITAAWEKYVDAWLSTQRAAINFMEFPDFSRLAESDVSEFLESTPLSEVQKKQVLAASDKNKTYSNIVTHREINEAGADIFHGRLLLRKNMIFLPNDLARKFDSELTFLAGVQTERLVSFRSRTTMLEQTTALFETKDRRFDDLASAVRERLSGLT